MRKPIQYNTHHLLARITGGTNHPDNKIEMDIRKHCALHCLFDTLPPHKQLEYLVELAWPIFTHDAKTELLKTLSIPDYSYWYKPEIYYK